ncbi:gliding motility-associated ABC transporter permease subunit GldF [Mesohalobacter halotolerans]|jgi:ABC-2 type transport system permease protein|uniref:Gliding motility-associated ABC transporter permease subunit GldF n=1 Tax=Mesohalobacter halotolerans TaxID=1883405 RepID=A0A4U5TP52_9FLAO|nr:gliding motility-associated ABC transporter permease subunit GldF [Mesohalobacter halotolerans]MBS3739212.1 gliding motility-associated ABC transporter permease subunit GldF [Psychroflexus sp.]NBC58896.1 gliding motility-associated ABC transporter permease subunit GldF [Bacteroidota bacterium]TKS55879.1 gliding motility-associated ABC transporter permease subunit GldF [Mesohalobacter halotolerans]
MLAIFKKEFFGFFSSIIGVLVIVIFLVVTGLMLWVFDTPYNIYNAAYADLTLFFELAPWVFLFLIPGICMKSFSEEQRQGTLELLLTKPVSIRSLVFGKFFGALVLSVIAILPSLIYVFCIKSLAVSPENIDYGAMAASYFGLLLLIAVYTAIGIFSSTLSQNQLTAFLIGLVLCLTVYYAFYGISTSGILGSNAFLIEFLSLKYHYKAMMRGVIDSRDLMFFASIWIVFMSFTFWRLKSMKN